MCEIWHWFHSVDVGIGELRIVRDWDCAVHQKETPLVHRSRPPEQVGESGQASVVLRFSDALNRQWWFAARMDRSSILRSVCW